MAEDVNITPDMINNLVDALKNSNNTNNSADSSDKKTNDSDFDLKNILHSFSFNNKSEKSDTSTNNIDMETIMKLKSILEALNQKDNPDSNLLYSLKPYLRKSRQDKLDQYVNILKISHISKMFRN